MNSCEACGAAMQVRPIVSVSVKVTDAERKELQAAGYVVVSRPDQTPPIKIEYPLSTEGR